jgi:addiction module HigA family antidote
MKTTKVPRHPGSILREDILPGRNLAVTAAANQIACARVMLSGIINEHASISPSMALLIEQWLGAEYGGRAELWAGMQLDYDMWQARQNKERAA